MTTDDTFAKRLERRQVDELMRRALGAQVQVETANLLAALVVALEADADTWHRLEAATTVAGARMYRYDRARASTNAAILLRCLAGAYDPTMLEHLPAEMVPDVDSAEDTARRLTSYADDAPNGELARVYSQAAVLLDKFVHHARTLEGSTR